MNTIFVGVAGGSGSGKSTLCRAMVSQLGDRARLIHHDSYYNDHGTLAAAADGLNFDHPDALDTSLLVSHLQQLRRGESVHTPVYDFATHRRTDKTVTVTAADVIIVEGILLFTDSKLVDQFDIRIFAQADSNVRRARRIDRDQRHRGRTEQSVIDQWANTVEPMFQQFVAPSASHAQLIVPCEVPNSATVELLTAGLIDRFEKNETNSQIEASDRA